MKNMSSYFSLLLFLTTFISAISGDFSDEQLIEQVTDSGDLSPHHHFTHFKKRFGKTYATQEEHDYRFSVFQANLRQAEINQKLDPTAKHGVTRFSDLSPDEFRKEYLGLSKKKLKYPAHANKADILPIDNLPVDFDWREKGAVTPPKNQGGCGSCWSFSATGGLEGAHFLATGKLESLSEQQLLDCDRECDPEGEPDDCDAGCAGGLMNNAYEYLLKAGGLMREDDYPYTAWDGTCKFDKTKIAARIANYSVVPADEDQMAANLVKYGPLPVGINARYMSSYISGVSCPQYCSDDLEHGVLIVGYGSSGYSPNRRQNKPYWIIKNSWGKNWGDDGYYKLCRGYNLCGINNLVSTVAAVK
ncbi:cysteine proteinase 15A-like [Silene latifolia]|uniref:cysteine proteinase 15A-like n=1 Tax=Silene latifolia TaxID=37657 RepID=UPI003D781424